MLRQWTSSLIPFVVRLVCVTSITAISFGLPSKAQADDGNLPTCSALFASSSVDQSDDEQRHNDLRRGCSLSWVERGMLRSLTWRYYEDDFAPPILSFSPTSGYLLTSQRPPSLIDVNHDGSRDLVTFNLIGVANGDFDIFFYDADRDGYFHAATLHGSNVDRDESGYTSYLVARSRDGVHSHFRFYEVSGREILPAFDIDPQDECTVTDKRPPFALADPDVEYDPSLIEYYCNIYDKTEAEDRRTPLIADTDLRYVPANTIFYCLLELRRCRNGAFGESSTFRLFVSMI